MENEGLMIGNWEEIDSGLAARFHSGFPLENND